MRTALACGLLVLGLTGCALRDLLPKGPVIGPEERARVFTDARDSGVTYESEPRVSFPVLPVQIFGVAYDVDIVLVSRHPRWNMHEIARLQTPEGPLWIAKDAREPTKQQFIVSGIDDVFSWVPEVPVVRKSWPVDIENHSKDALDVTAKWENVDGERVEVHYEGPLPTTRNKKRNGPTMGHSADAVIAVLDVSHRDFGRKASITFDGKRQRIRRILGIIPFRLVLQQTQGGIAVTDQDLAATRDSGFQSTLHTPGGHDVTLDWSVSQQDSRNVATTSSEFRTLRYVFASADDAAWELSSAEVLQWGRNDPTFHMELAPALPDLRRRFDGRHRSRYVIDVNGRENHAVGWIEVWWSDENTVQIRIEPTAPRWTTDRPMSGTLQYRTEGAHLQIERMKK